MEPSKGVLASLWNFICFLPYFIGLLLLGTIKGLVFCPLVCLIMSFGVSGIILGLWPAHFFWTLFSILSSKQLSPVLKLLLVAILPVLLTIWLTLGIPVSIIGGAAFGFLQPIFATFDAVGEGKSDPFYHCLVDGTWSTIQGSFTIIRDFLDVCFHSYFSYMDELRSEGKYYEIRLILLPEALVAGVLGIVIDVPIITVVAVCKSPYMLLKGWGRLVHDLIGREGPFLETFCVPFAGLAILLWPLAVAGGVIASMLSSLVIGGYAAVVVYQEFSFLMGLRYIIASLAIYDEYSNDVLDMREGSCFPKLRYRKTQLLSRTTSSLQRPESVKNPLSRSTSQLNPMAELNPFEARLLPNPSYQPPSVMADSGQAQPPDPGGPQKELIAGSPSSCWPPLEAATRSFAAVTKAPKLSRFPTINLATRPPDQRKTSDEEPTRGAAVQEEQSGGAPLAGGRTFATVSKAQGGSRFPPIRFTARQYGTKDGKPSVSFSPAELQVGMEHLKHSLVVKFSSGRPAIEEVRNTFLTAWGFNSGQCSIGAWDARHILVVLDSEQDASKILAHPMRKLGHSMFRVFRWDKDFSTRREPTTTTAWIRLAKLPPEMYNKGYIEAIVASFGRFLAVDNRTVWFLNPSYARVCVELDISKDLPNKVWVATGLTSGFWQEIVYENRLQYCTKCKLHGHLITTCRKVKQKHAEDTRIWAARDELGLPTSRSLVPAPEVAEDVPVKAQLSRDQLPISLQQVVDGKSFTKNREETLNKPNDATPHAPQHDDKSSSLTIEKQPQQENKQEPEWMIVQKRKRDKNSFSQRQKQAGLLHQLNQSAPEKSINDKNQIQSILDEDNAIKEDRRIDAQTDQTNVSQGNETSKDGLESPQTLSNPIADKSGNADLLPNLNVVSAKYALPPLTFSRRTRDLDIGNKNKISTPVASQKNRSITKSPRSACRRSPSAPGFLLPRVNCLPTRDVQRPPTS